MPAARRLLASSLLTCAIALTATSAARANLYTVQSCRAPDGRTLASLAWQGDRQSDAEAVNACAAGGPLAVGMIGAGPWQGGTGAELRFTAPPATRIASLRLQRRTIGVESVANGLAYRLVADDRNLDGCYPGAAAPCTANLDGLVDLPSLDAGVVRLKVGCLQSFPDRCTLAPAAPPLRVEVAQVAVGLRDDTAPVVANVKVTGAVTATFDAADAGGGLYRTLVLVDGQVNQANPIAAGDCTDLTPADADPYVFAVPQPCPSSVNAVSAGIDAATLTPGKHVVEVVVEDASGNRASVLAPQTITVPPRGGVADNGAGADVKGLVKGFFVLTHSDRATSRFGRRTVIRGHLYDRRGRPIVGARLDVEHRLRGRATALVKTGLKTRARGLFTLILPNNLTSRTITIAYRASRPGPVTSRVVLRLKVVDKAGRAIVTN